VETRSEKQLARICLCGEMTVEIGGRVIEPRGVQGRKLLAYLVANRSRPLRRDELLEVLWEGRPPADPDSSLAAALSHLRHELGPEVLPPREVSLRLPEGTWVDLEAIDDQAQRTAQALEEGMPDKAVLLAEQTLELMKGFLPGLEAKWIDERRRELAELRLSVQEAAVDASLQLGGARLLGAKRMAQGLVREAPYRESGYELLMRVHAASGNVAEANRVYHSLRALLCDELGTMPGPAVTELNDRLLRQEEAEGGATGVAHRRPLWRDSPKPREQVPLPPLFERMPDESFVGRDEALGRLWARWEKVSFRPRVVALTGEPGIGKTSLAACFSRQVHGAGATVLYGRCDADPLTACQPFVEALDHYAGVRDLHQEPADDAEELRRRIRDVRRRLASPYDEAAPVAEDRDPPFESIAAVLRHAGQGRSLLLVIDDVHWADALTFKVILYLVRYLDLPRCMFVTTFRDADASRPGERSNGPAESHVARLDLLRHDAEIERIPVDGLDEHETAALIAARRGDASIDVSARDLMNRTGGNPFFIEEVLRGLVEHHGPGEAGRPDLQRLGVPEGVAEVIARRLDRLGSHARKVSVIASVIGVEFNLSLVEAVLKLPSEDVLESLEELIEAGLIVEVPTKPDRFAFSHALVRETQYQRLIASRRVRSHGQIALELERQADDSGGEGPVTPAELAHHFYEARAVLEAERVAYYSIQAARYAKRSGAYEEAITHYGRALELLASAKGDELQICDLLLARGKVQLRAGRRDEAERTFAGAADIARRSGAVDRLALAALGYKGMYIAAGEIDRKGIDLLREAQAALGDDDSPLRVRVLARLSESLLWLAPDQALELSGQAVTMARRLEDGTAIRDALGGRHAALLHAQHLEERWSVSRERLDLAAEAGNREAEAEALRWYMSNLCERGEIRAAKEQYARLTGIARELRQPQYLSYVAHWACVFAQLHGRLDEAERLADEGFELAKRAGARDIESSRLLKRVLIYREQGRLAELRPAVEQVVADVPTLKAWRTVGALIDAQTGHEAEARAQVDRLVVDDAAALPKDVFWLLGVATLAETCALLPDTREPAAVLYALLRPYADHCVQVGMISVWGSASRFLGLAATASGDWEAAHRHFSIARKRNESLGSKPLVARTLVDHAGMLLRRREPGDTDTAARLLVRAMSLAASLHMEDLCRRAADLQTQAGRRAALA
jgi:DNA-binding SARP family transcriptional activator/tetratricopeptide (TPR) repeat protein